MSALLGKKIGMTQVFDEKGVRVCVTAIEAGPCPVLSMTDQNLQLGFEAVREKAVSKPLLGMFKKLNITPRRFIRGVSRDAAIEYKIGDELKVDMFKPGDMVDVTGTSIGKGFQGGMKRWHWKGGPMTHGSTSHRRIGSTGSTTTPGRVWRGHHQAGHMGNHAVTTLNLRVIRVDLENNLLLIRGPVPGSKNGFVIIRKAIKQ